jgi:hypothetical protein
MMDGRLKGSMECEGRRNVARHRKARQDANRYQKTIEPIANVGAADLWGSLLCK